MTGKAIRLSECIDLGNKIYTVENTPKIVGGITARCTEVAAVYYEQFIDSVVRVSSARAAEMVKLLENTFRAVNIGLVNELALMCDRMEIDVWEIVDAAATKPFGLPHTRTGDVLVGVSLLKKQREGGTEFRPLLSKIAGSQLQFAACRLLAMMSPPVTAIGRLSILATITHVIRCSKSEWCPAKGCPVVCPCPSCGWTRHNIFHHL